MKKRILAGLLAMLLSGCSSALPSNEQSSALVGEWICHSVPTKDKLTYDRLDHFILKEDGSGMMRGISSIDMQDSKIRYLLKAQSKWQVKDNQLIFEFIHRSMVPAHSKNVAEAIKHNKELQQHEKETLDNFYSPSSDHVEMPIKLSSNNEFILGNEDLSICRRVDVTKPTKEMKLLDKLFKNKR